MTDMTASPATFRERLAEAAASGVLLGVRYAIIVVLLGTAILWLMGDYAVTRQNAAFAASYIQQVIQQQQATRPGPAKP